jgi:hypothetical protein|tara:strand:- start:738 stop:1334 length:597 start_codon:yes stop_codon:yes gene_type:complete
LKGFIKGSHHEPDTCFPAAEAFIRKIGRGEIEELAEGFFQSFRHDFGWKRKEIACTHEDAGSLLRTPDFELSLSLDQDSKEPRLYQQQVELSGFSSLETLATDTFSRCFHGHLDTVRINFTEALDLAAVIDEWEEKPEIEPLMEYPSDISSVLLRPSDTRGIELRLLSHEAEFRLIHGGDLRSLIVDTQAMLNELELG